MIATNGSDSNPGRLHKYTNKLVAFEHESTGDVSNVLLWIGGLGDGLLTVSYPKHLAKTLPTGWTLVEVQITSSLHGWGCGSLQRDVKELAQCVAYFRNLMRDKGKIILMGHSTGCQDAIEYISGVGAKERMLLDGMIIQAPVSDREAALRNKPVYDQLAELSKAWIDDGKADCVLPVDMSRPFFQDIPVTAYRCHSLLSPHRDGDDDFFTSDLEDHQLQKTFGAFTAKTPLLILWSGADEHVPSYINAKAVVSRWKTLVEASGGIVSDQSGIVENAHHNLNQSDEIARQDLYDRVNSFLKTL